MRSNSIRTRRNRQRVIRMEALHLCILALLALCGGALARPSEEGAQANSAAAPDTFPANCAHTPQGDVTAEQVQGIWYVLEVVYISGQPVDTQKPKSIRTPPCIVANLTAEGTRLTMFFKSGEREDVWIVDPATSGLWEDAENTTAHLSTSADRQLLVVCVRNGGIGHSLLLSRRPLMDEAVVTAARSPTFSSTRVLRPDMQSCVALPAASAVATAATAASSNPLPA